MADYSEFTIKTPKIFSETMKNLGYDISSWIKCPLNSTNLEEFTYVFEVTKKDDNGKDVEAYIAKFGVSKETEVQKAELGITKDDIENINNNFSGNIINRINQKATNPYLGTKKEYTCLVDLYTSDYVIDPANFTKEIEKIDTTINENGFSWKIFGFMMSKYPTTLGNNNQIAACVANWKKEYGKNLLVANIGYCVSRALCALKAHGITHRDIKPENIFINNVEDFKQTRFLLGDFNVSDEGNRLYHTTAAAGVGTNMYMPPEANFLERKEKELGEGFLDFIKNHDFSVDSPTAQSTYDIFSLGMTLYSLLGGTLDSWDTRMKSKTYKLWREKRQEIGNQPEETDEELWKIIMKMTAYDPKDRYFDPKTLRIDFAKVIKHLDVKNILKISKKEPELFSTEELEVFSQDFTDDIAPELLGEYSADKKTFIKCGLECQKHVFIPDSVEIIGKNAFSNCKNIEYVKIGNNVKKIESCAFSGCEKLTVVRMTNSVSSIGDSAFEGCFNLTNITIPNNDNIMSVGDNAFSGCKKLTTFSLNNILLSIGDKAFEGCSNLTSITIPNGVMSIRNGAFSKCKKLSTVNLTNSTLSIGDFSFEGCSNLTYIIITDSVISIGTGAFWGCSELNSIKLSKNILSIEPNTFRDCQKITYIDIPDNVSSIGASAFKNCISLKNVRIGNHVERISFCAFEQCKSLTDIVIPYGVKEIGFGVFSECEKLKSISIPDSVSDITPNAFRGCSSLSNVKISKKKALEFSEAFKGTPFYNSLTQK